MNEQKITKMQKMLITDSTIFVADIDLFLVELNLKVIKKRSHKFKGCNDIDHFS